MILNRIATAVKKQDWFVVLVELLIVVVGIYIGLQVDDWQKERENRALEKEYLARILVDLEEGGNAFDNMARLAEERRESVYLLRDALTDDLLVRESPTVFIQAVDQAAYTFFPVLFDDTYEEIKSSGQLFLIRDAEVKKALARYYSLTESMNQWADQQRATQAKYYDATMTVLTFNQNNIFGDNKTFTVEDGQAVRERLMQIENIEAWLSRLEGMQEFIHSIGVRGQRENAAIQEVIRTYLDGTRGEAE